MKYLMVLVFLGIVIQSIYGQRLFNNDDNEKSSATVNNADDAITANRRPTGNNFNGRFKKVLKVKKEKSQESLPLGTRQSRQPTIISEDSSVSASSNKNSFTVNSFDDADDDYFSRRRARFLFRQRVGK